MNLKINNKSGLLSINENSSKTTKIRESNIELFRIIIMLLIIAHHYVVNSGLTRLDGPIASSPMSWRSIFLLLFGAWGKTGINCFVMITGYFMCKSKITVKKFVKLIGQWLFYRYLFYFIFLISGYEPFNLKSFLMGIVPIYQIEKNFTSCFVVFWLCIPFLNILISHLTEKQHFFMLIIMGFTYIILGTTHTVSFNYVTWFCVLYLIASYIRFYPKKWMYRNTVCGSFIIISIVISVISVIICQKFINSEHSMYKQIITSPFMFVSDSNTLLAVIIGVFSFLFFRNIKIPYNRFINTIAGSTFGVLCIHANSNTMRRFLWYDLFDNIGHYNSNILPIHAIGSVIIIFIVCVLIDIVRIKIIEKPFFVFWDKNWDSFLLIYKKMEKKVFSKFNIE